MTSNIAPDNLCCSFETAPGVTNETESKNWESDMLDADSSVEEEITFFLRPDVIPPSGFKHVMQE